MSSSCTSVKKEAPFVRALWLLMTLSSPPPPIMGSGVHWSSALGPLPLPELCPSRLRSDRPCSAGSLSFGAALSPWSPAATWLVLLGRPVSLLPALDLSHPTAVLGDLRWQRELVLAMASSAWLVTVLRHLVVVAEASTLLALFSPSSPNNGEFFFLSRS